jgi:hypothetical protein
MLLLLWVVLFFAQVVQVWASPLPDLILGMERDLALDSVHRFFRSFRRSGGTAHIVIFSSSAPNDGLEAIARYYAPAEILYRDHEKGMAWCGEAGPILYRFELYREWLAHRWGEYRRILLSDVRDVVFQRDPFLTIEIPSTLSDTHGNMHEHGLVFALEGRVPLGAVEFSRRILSVDYPQEQYPGMLESIKCKPLLCAGTIIGSSKAIHSLLELVRLSC